MELNHLTGFLVHRTDLKMTNFFTKILKQHEVTPEQWGILLVLDTERATSQKELAEAIDRDQTTVVRMIYSLEKKEIVRRIQSDVDKRSHNLFLSEKGMSLKTKLMPIVKAAHDHVTKYLSNDEIIQLHVILSKLYSTVKDE
ncbi:MarR family transcriptional regulator [Paenibacillus sp. CGMCC 1.16610]|uniref:MarR family transcriptional regulator n=1 Tax=Paenibacillus anseongense TaxID=2682845 RepID=A0ABW9UKX0_9BACL|nr:MULTISPECIES: MarR family transcriptional regulator [Paenibacillus]MBA2941088.1 MarR family transcriptional regulator [Paenibacillus sp. CGMCC 1.16610]MVQ39907.1 MarR family transcriptional regulator [Paenibacillus anseongense]